MKRNLKTWFMAIGVVLLLVGAVLQISESIIAPILFTIGSLFFCYIQVYTERYEGSNFIIRRLRRQQIFGAVMLVITGVLMFICHQNEWILSMTISAIFELYTAFRIPYELEKENKTG